MLSEVGVVVFENALLKAPCFHQVVLPLEGADNFGHAADHEVFFETLDEHIVQRGKVIHVAAFERIGEGVAGRCAYEFRKA